jgi:hypothetical protein
MASVDDCLYGDHRERAWRRCGNAGYPLLSHRGTGGRGWAPADVAHLFDEA